MNTVLFFVYSNKYICANRIAGARRYAERRGWNIQVVERAGDKSPKLPWAILSANFDEYDCDRHKYLSFLGLLAIDNCQVVCYN